MEDWLTHYLNEGVDHFYLIDNNSSDNYLPLLRKYIQKGIVDLYIEPVGGNQMRNYNKRLSQIKEETKWIMVVDFDEFLYA